MRADGGLSMRRENRGGGNQRMQSNQQSLAFRLENGKSPEALHLFAAGVQLDTLQAASRSIPQNGGTTSIEGRVVQRKVKTRHQPFPPKTWLEGENNLTKKPSNIRIIATDIQPRFSRGGQARLFLDMRRPQPNRHGFHSLTRGGCGSGPAPPATRSPGKSRPGLSGCAPGTAAARPVAAARKGPAPGARNGKR